MLARYLSILLLTSGVALGVSISDYSESALNSRAPSLHHVSNYYRSDYEGLVEIGYKYVIKPGHYGWLWMFPLAAGIKAGEDAKDKGRTLYFDSSNGDYIGDNKQEARRTVANRREERRRREAEALISEGNALLLADKYEEAFSKFEQVLLAAPSHEEALRKRNLVNNVLEGNKNWEKADKELQAANESRLKRNYNNALAHYHKALEQYRLAVGGFEKVIIQDTRFKGKLLQAQAAVTDLEGTIAAVKLEAESKGVQLDINWNVDVLMNDVINEGEENINAEAATHLVVDRG